MFANNLPRIGVLNGNSDCTGCVGGGGVVFLSQYRPVFNLSASCNALSVGNGI